MHALAALALIAALYHCLNHACMKSLLFLGTGAVLHATGERNLGKLGGLIHRMPWVAWLTLVGVLAIAGLPPLNGFVSEWLLLQAFLFVDTVPRAFVNMLLPVGAAIVALCTALAGYVMVKFYGVVFLGQPREAGTLARRTTPAGSSAWAWRGSPSRCVALGVLPVQVIAVLDTVSHDLLGAALAASSGALVAAGAGRGARRLLRAAGVPGRVHRGRSCVTMVAVRMFYHRRVRRAPPWDCGFVRLDARMQDTAEGFGQPIRHIFQPFFLMTRTLPTPFDRLPAYRVTVADRIWRYGYEPAGPARAPRGVTWSRCCSRAASPPTCSTAS